MQKQQGLSLASMMLVSILVVVVLVTVFKLIPAFTEYYSIKSSIVALVKEQSGAPAESIRESFGKRLEIENVKTVQPVDLNIEQSKEGTTLSIEYQKVVPLVSNASILFNFKVEESSSAPAESK